MPLETVVVLVPMAAKGMPLAAKLAAATKAGATVKYMWLGPKLGVVPVITASKPGMVLPMLANKGNLAAQLMAGQPAMSQVAAAAPQAAATTSQVAAAAPQTAATTSQSAASTTTVNSLLTKASNLVSQAQSLYDSVSTNILPLLGIGAAGAAGGAAGGAVLQGQQNKKQKQAIDSLSTKSDVQQQAVETLQSDLNATKQKVDAVAAAVSAQPAPAPDNLEDIKGIGPVYEKRLNEGGIFTFADLAQATPEQVAEIMEKDDQSFLGDPADWIQQARELAGLDDNPAA